MDAEAIKGLRKSPPWPHFITAGDRGDVARTAYNAAIDDVLELVGPSVPSFEAIAAALNAYELEAATEPWPPDEMLGKHHVGCMHVGRIHDHLEGPR